MASDTILVVKNLFTTVGGRFLFNDISFAVKELSRVGLVGTNGSGKTTLLRLLAKYEETERGEISYRRDAVVEYVPQFVPEGLKTVSVLQCVSDKLMPSDQDNEWRAYEILDLLEVASEQYEMPLGALSGGEAIRVLLARALAASPNLLLLDEPTNHMDTEAISSFERLLAEDLDIPFCIVSHDRAILDNLTDETIFLRDERSYHFELPYSRALEELRVMDESARRRRSSEEKEVRRLKESANRLRTWTKTNSDRAASFRSMVRRVEKLEERLTFVSREPTRRLGVDASAFDAPFLFRIPELEVTVGEERRLYSVHHCTLSPGDRAVILGRNGAGKTTFLRHVTRAFDKGGTEHIRFNPQVKIGYYDQDLALFPDRTTLFEHVVACTDEKPDVIRRDLIAAGFPYERHGDRIGMLSGGEKARLRFLILKLQRPNLLLLDEPTNHIDVQGIERLEQELLEFEGACLFVSHDRTFVRNVANRHFLIREDELREIGSVEQYYEMITAL